MVELEVWVLVEDVVEDVDVDDGWEVVEEFWVDFGWKIGGGEEAMGLSVSESPASTSLASLESPPAAADMLSS